MARTHRLVSAASLGMAVGVLSFACQRGVDGAESKHTEQLAESGAGRRILLGMNLISYTEDPGEKDLEEARSLGAQAVRMWVNWRTIEAKPGEFSRGVRSIRQWLSASKKGWSPGCLWWEPPSTLAGGDNWMRHWTDCVLRK